MKATTNMTSKITKAAVIGAVGVSALAIWGRAPIARATDAAMSFGRVSAALRGVKAELNLTEEQQAKLQSIVREAIPQGMAIHDDASLSPAEKRARLQELRNATQRRAEEVLTPEQRRKAGALFASAKPRVQARLQQVAQELDLTETQKTEIQPIVANAFKEGMAIKNNMSLTLAQKFTKAQQLRSETREQLSSILSPEQMEKLDSIIAAAQTDVAAIVREQRQRNIN